MVTLRSALAAGPVVLDGGLSNELEAAGHDLSDELWSARLLADDPGAIRAAHRAYYAAGAQVTTTASYQASVSGFARRGVDTGEAEALIARSVRLARDAAEQAAEQAARGAGASGDRPRWVAASVGPYGATLAGGQEYRGRYGLSVAELERFHRPRMEVLAAAEPDILAIETIPDVDEAEALLRVLDGLHAPAWLSYTIDGARTRAGQPLAEAFALLADSDDVVAVGVNCSDAADVDTAVRIARGVTGKPVVAYPNSGETWDGVTRTWRGRPTFEPALVRGWVDAGARLVGGCCRVGPDAIAGIAEVVSDARTDTPAAPPSRTF